MIVQNDEAFDEGFVHLFYYISYFNTAALSLCLSSTSRRYPALIYLFYHCALRCHFYSIFHAACFWMYSVITPPTGFLVFLAMYYLGPLFRHFRFIISVKLTATCRDVCLTR